MGGGEHSKYINDSAYIPLARTCQILTETWQPTGYWLPVTLTFTNRHEFVLVYKLISD